MQGKISVVGIGPGSPKHLTKKAEKEIKESNLIIGYKTYIKLLKKEFPQKDYIKGKMGGEVDRAKKAIQNAKNQKVTIICGGDPNIYALAGLTLEIAKKKDYEGKIEVIPGVTALNALGSNFNNLYSGKIAVISLSDYLASWNKIKKRIKKASKNDFNIVFYNPKSKKRPKKLKKAIKIILKHKNKEEDVIIGRDLGREKEWIKKTKLGKISNEKLYQKIDMKTVLAVTSSNSNNLQEKNTEKIKIAGIGPGSIEQITNKVYNEIKSSKKVFSSKKYLREIDPILKDKKIKTHENLPYKKRTDKRIQEAKKSDFKSIILSAGDPSIYGPKIHDKEIIPPKLPSISSFQALAAKSGAPLVSDFVILSPSNKNYLKTIKEAIKQNFGIIVFNNNKRSLKSIKENIDPKKPIVLGKNVTRDNNRTFIGYTKKLSLNKLDGKSNWTLIIPNKKSVYWEEKNYIISKRGYGKKYEY